MSRLAAANKLLTAQQDYAWQEQPRQEATYPDVLEVLAVDRVDDAVGAN